MPTLANAITRRASLLLAALLVAAGIATTAKEPAAAKKMIAYFVSPSAEPVIRKSGLEPARAR
ncbi:MAG: hypothetical protein EOP80_14060 [Variovorax sp.]|nr:MAG: hypothetical protein EOP80_14060 [Variovorax sp.]